MTKSMRLGDAESCSRHFWGIIVRRDRLCVVESLFMISLMFTYEVHVSIEPTPFSIADYVLAAVILHFIEFKPREGAGQSKTVAAIASNTAH